VTPNSSAKDVKYSFCEERSFGISPFDTSSIILVAMLYDLEALSPLLRKGELA
jgi:hypothetical protein